MIGPLIILMDPKEPEVQDSHVLRISVHVAAPMISWVINYISPGPSEIYVRGAANLECIRRLIKFGRLKPATSGTYPRTGSPCTPSPTGACRTLTGRARSAAGPGEDGTEGRAIRKYKYTRQTVGEGVAKTRERTLARNKDP